MADESFLSGMGCNEKSSRDCERELETGKFGKYKKKAVRDYPIGK
jgi:hypothetical protein